MALLGVAGSFEGVEPVGEPFEQRLGGEQLRPGGRELERKRKAVEPVAELHDGVGAGHIGSHGLCALAEEGDRLLARERWEVELGLALDPQRLAAGGEQSQGGDSGHELGQRTRGAGEEVLEVVADEVRSALADSGCDRGGLRRRGAEPVGDRRQNELRVTKRRERHEDGPSFGVVTEQARELDREPGLAGSTRPDDREDPGVALVDSETASKSSCSRPRKGVAGSGSSTLPGVRSGGNSRAPS